MTVDIVNPGLAGAVLGNLDLDRAVELVRQVCRIPSVLGGEGELAGFLASVMRASGPAQRPRRGQLRAGAASRPDRSPGHQARVPRLAAGGPVLGRPHRRSRLRPWCHGHEGGPGLPNRRDRGGEGQPAAALGNGCDGRGRRPHGGAGRLDRLLRHPPGGPVPARRAHRQPGVPGAPGPVLLRRDRPGPLGPHLPQARRGQRQRAGRPGGAGPGPLQAGA